MWSRWGRAALFVAVALLAGCGDEPEPPDTIGEPDAELVGTWTGEVSGSFGVSDMTLELSDDGSYAAVGSGDYCPMDGRWGVIDDRFKAVGNDDCDGTRVTLSAVIGASDELAGRWNASSGNSGGFSVQKQ